MRHKTLDLTSCATCPLRSGPCLAGMAFLERLSHALGLARRVTGAVPDMGGEITLTQCPACDHCVLRWQAEGGALELGYDGHVLLRGRMTAQLAQ